MLAARPRKRVRKLRLVTEDVGLARLSDGERHVSGACVGCGERLRFPERDGVAVQISDAGFVDEIRVDDRCQIRLRRQ